MLGTRRRRWAAAGAALLIAACAGVWLTQSLRARETRRTMLPQVSGRIEAPGVERAVGVDRDRIGVPHIDAESERDAFFTLGYVHAQDRLAQLLLLRRRARGTSSEVVGTDGVAGDRLARLIDFDGLAARQWPHLERGTRRVLEAYAAGVNARLSRLEPAGEATAAAADADGLEPWRPEDSLAVFKLFAWSLSESVEASLVLNDLVVALGSVEAGRFFPPRGDGARPAGGRATAGARRGEVDPPDLDGVAVDDVMRGAASLRRALGLAGYGVGSSAFVVGGRHTRSGRPILVADSHFEPTAPAVLYLAHLRAPDLDVAGATLPGVPLFWWGRNPDLAWAAVHAGAVVTDLYQETTRKDGAEYHDGRRWRPLEERSELLRVRGGKDATLAIRQTTRGPLLPGLADGEAISVSWTGARTGGASGIGSLLDVARAGDADEVRAALRRHHEPPIALVWAEASGRAGLQVAGWIPRRTLSSQMLPLPGRARWYAWDEPVPFEALPARVLQNGRDHLVAADQLFQGDVADEPIDGVWRTGVRRDRLVALLGEATREPVELRAAAALAMDVGLDRSREVAQTALALAGDAVRAEEALELAQWLGDWDGRATPESIGASAYHTYLHVLAEALFAERMGQERFERYLALGALDLEALVQGVLIDAASGGAGDAWSEPDAVRAAVVESLRETWLALSFRHGPDPRRWAWGTLHALRFRSLEGSRSRLGPYLYGGGPHAVLAGAYDLGSPDAARFDVRVASTARFAVDAASLDLALVALAPGQSEHPSHPHFDDGVEGWLGGRFALLATRRLEVEDRSVARLVLEPVR